MPFDYLLDTNIAVHALDGLLLHPLPLHNTYAMSAITRLELLGKPGLTAEDERIRMGFIARIPVLPIRERILDRAIDLRRNRNLRTPDAIIAATTLHYNAVLLTNDADLLRALGPMAQSVALATSP